MKTGRPRELSTTRCAQPGCTDFVTRNDLAHSNRRCKPCRDRGPNLVRALPVPKAKPDRKHSTEDSAWQGAAREDFTAIMTAHFAALRPGLSYFNARDSKERVAGSKRSLRSVPL